MPLTSIILWEEGLFFIAQFVLSRKTNDNKIFIMIQAMDT